MPESIGSGGGFLDYDNDGDLDIYLINGASRPGGRSGSTPTNRLFRQKKDGTFEDVTAESGLGDAGFGFGMGVAAADMDNDGDVDLYVTNFGPDRLYLNNGDGTFSDVTARAGVNNGLWGCSAVFVDVDRDGWLDLFVTNYVAYDPSNLCMDRAGRPDYCGPDGFSGTPDKLFRNRGDGTFEDISRKSGIASALSKGMGVVAEDLNGDGWPDIYVASDGTPNHLWINQSDGSFRDEALLLGAAVNGMGQAEAGMGIALGDLDGDLDSDLFVTHLRLETNTFYRNAGAVGFVDDTTPAGLGGPSTPYTGFGTSVFDFDHDGDLDIAVVNGRVTRGPLLTGGSTPSYWDDYAEPNLLFENDGAGRFRDISDGAEAFAGIVENSRGLAVGDVDSDGDLDMLVTNEGGKARLYLNEASKEGNWVVIDALLPQLNRTAIGAVVTVHAGGKRFVRTVHRGGSYLSTQAVRAHFGLGSANALGSITVRWPDGEEETFPGGDVNRFITVTQGGGIAL